MNLFPGYQDDVFKNNGITSPRQYLIYNDKTDKFRPFVPISNKSTTDTSSKKRNHDREIKLTEELSNEIIFEDLTRWYPIWNMPF